MVKVAVVTGSNKGIGFAIVRGLCKHFEGDVYLTARDEGRGQEAVRKLKEENLNPQFHQLDITDPASIARLKSFLQKKYQGLDLLVNNAGIAFPEPPTGPSPARAEETMRINFWGTLDISKQLLPLLRPGARVVMVSSRIAGIYANNCTEPAKTRIRNCTKIQEIEKLMTDFVSAVGSKTIKRNGWPEMSYVSYGMSKVGMSLITPVLQAMVAADTSRPNILINNCCPGFVDTDLTGHKGTQTVEEGADTPLFLSMLPQDATGPRGEFYCERKPYKWI